MPKLAKYAWNSSDPIAPSLSVSTASKINGKVSKMAFLLIGSSLSPRNAFIEKKFQSKIMI